MATDAGKFPKAAAQEAMRIEKFELNQRRMRAMKTEVATAISAKPKRSAETQAKIAKQTAEAERRKAKREKSK